MHLEKIKEITANHKQISIKNVKSMHLIKEKSYFVATIVQKSDPKISKNGQKFVHWKLRDIDEDKIATGSYDVSIFMFGCTFNLVWKFAVGTTVAVLNPKLLNAKKEATEFVIKLPNQIIEFGQSPNLVLCNGYDVKSENKCSEYINNLSGSKYCVKHLQQVLKKTLNKRPELLPSYGAHTRPLTISGVERYPNKISRYSKLEQKEPIEENDDIKGIEKNNISTNTLNSLVKLSKSTMQQTPTNMIKKEPPSKSQSAKLFLYQTMQKISENNTAKRKNYSSIPRPMLQNSQLSLIGENGLISKKLIHNNDVKISKHINDKIDLRPPTNEILTNSNCDNNQPNNIISFNLPSNMPMPFISKPDTSRFSRVLSRITLKPINPNNPNKKFLSSSPTYKTLMKERATKNMNSFEKDRNKKNCKKPRIVAGLLMDEEKIQNIFQQKSRNNNLISQHESEQEHKYFDLMESTESVKQAMSTVMEIKCNLVTCSQCKYTFWSAGPVCKKDHPKSLTYAKGIKRFFQCKDCKQRTQTYLTFPAKPCKSCNSYNYERIAMYKDWKDETDILQPHEKLLVRGEEHSTFLNQTN